MEKAWRQSVEASVAELSESDLREVVTRLRVVSQRHETLVVEAPNRLAADVVRERCLEALQRALTQASGGQLRRIALTVPSGPQRELFPSPPPPKAPGRAVGRRSALLPKYTFDNFVVGASNQFAHAASIAVANQPSDHYNPLFIYGGVGLGKTHLVNAIGHQVLDGNEDARVVYLSADSFINVLIVDDVQFLAGRERTQEEFFHTFNSLYESHHQIVLTSDKFPKEIPDLEERLRNRFEWGLIADIQPPDVETRVAILEKKAEFEGIELPQEVAIFIATNIDSNVRELEGSLTRLGAFASLNKCPITVDFARDVLQSVLRDRANRIITIESIQKAVCDFFRIRPNDLRSKKRTRTVALPRQLAMYLCRRHTNASFPVIGDRFGGRDHSTVIHAAQVIERRLREDPTFRATVKRLERLLERPS